MNDFDKKIKEELKRWIENDVNNRNYRYTKVNNYYVKSLKDILFSSVFIRKDRILKIESSWTYNGTLFLKFKEFDVDTGYSLNDFEFINKHLTCKDY
jgi:hypothetical protein